MTKPTPTQNLMTMLNLTPTEPVGGDEAFSAVTLTRESPRTYGGQVLAQAIMAANSTVTDKVLHSIHAYFLRPGDITKELIFTSQRLNDGRSFATRRVQALQDDIPIFSAIASFQAPGSGPEHTAVTMPQAPDPEGLPSVSDYIGEVPHPVAQAVAWERPIDIRYVSPHLYTAPDSSSQEPVATVWFKTFDTLADATGAPAGLTVRQQQTSGCCMSWTPPLRRAGGCSPAAQFLRAMGSWWPQSRRK